MDEKEFRIMLVKHDINMTELAKKIGISVPSMYNKVNGKTSFTVPEILKIRDVLHLSVDEYLRVFTKFQQGQVV